MDERTRVKGMGRKVKFREPPTLDRGYVIRTGASRMSDQKKKLLIVDDDPHIRRLLSIYFRDRFEVFSASEGDEALDIWERESPDVILLDLILPSHGGFGLCKDFRAGPTQPIIIMITGEEGEDTREVATECGVDGFLLKPFDPKDLVALVDDQLSRAS